MLSDLYPSRKGPEPQILLRHDPVVYTDLSDGIVLTREQKESFDKNGYLVLNGLFSDIEVKLLQRELYDMRLKLQKANDNPEVVTERQSGEVRSIFRIHRNSPVFERLSRDSRLVNVARDILADDVYIHQSRLNYKPGFEGREFYWHSDFETWHVEDGLPNMRAISISVTLTENLPQNGALMMIPGSHRDYISCVGKTPEHHYKMSLQKQEYGVPDPHSLEYLANKGGIDQVTGPAGTVVIFDCNVMHGSNGNITPYPRSNAFFVYNSVQNRARTPFADVSPRPEFIAARKEIEIVKPQQDALLSGSVSN